DKSRVARAFVSLIAASVSRNQEHQTDSFNFDRFQPPGFVTPARSRGSCGCTLREAPSGRARLCSRAGRRSVESDTRSPIDRSAMKTSTRAAGVTRLVSHTPIDDLLIAEFGW